MITDLTNIKNRKFQMWKISRGDLQILLIYGSNNIGSIKTVVKVKHNAYWITHFFFPLIFQIPLIIYF